MNTELLLLKLLLYNNNYSKYNSIIDYSYLKEYNTELYYIYNVLKDLYEISETVTLDDLKAYFFTKYPDHIERYEILFDTLESLDISSAIADTLLQEMAQKKAALRLSERSLAFTQGRSTLDEVRAVYDDLYKDVKVEETEDQFVSTDIEFLANSVVATPGLRWRLQCLNKSLGSLRKGDFGAIFARPETGKTTLLASESSNMLPQLKDDEFLHWYNNEEQGSKVMLRIAQAYFGIRMDQLLSDLKRYRDLFMEQVGHKIKFIDSANIDRGLVEDLVSKYKPGLVVFDQLDKVKGFKAERDDLLYGTIYQWGRELAKQYCPVISVCQADGTAEGVKWLYMNHMALAKTSKQAECDWILGVGKSHNDGEDDMRYLNISKNKLMGDQDSNPELKHGRFDVLIRPMIARYEDIIQYD